MAAKALLTKAFKHGRDLFRFPVKAKVPDVRQPAKESLRIQPVQVVTPIRTFFFASRVSYQTLASQLRRRAALEFGRNKNLPIFAFVGLALATNTQQEENEVFSTDIREVLQKTARTSPIIHQFSLGAFEFGNLIGKGCNAVVYEARIKGTDIDIVDNDIPYEKVSSLQDNTENEGTVKEDVEEEDDKWYAPEVEEEEDKWYPPMDDFQRETTENNGQIGEIIGSQHLEDRREIFVCLKREEESDSFVVLNESDGSSESLILLNNSFEEPFAIPSDVDYETDCMSMLSTDSDSDIDILDDEAEIDEGDKCFFDDFDETRSCISVMSSHADMDVEEDSRDSWSCVFESADTGDPVDNKTSSKFDLAIKMMFNYEVESKADSIMKAMEKETVPARVPIYQLDDEWFVGNKVRLKSLPHHTNIVDMVGAFVDPFDAPQMSVAMETYPAALPKRLHSNGLGRNMTMYIVMKKYDMTLREYLEQYDPDTRTRCILLAQLLEGIVHLGNHGIAHRDIKTDNIFIDLSDNFVPHLVIGDFGCCLADKEFDQKLPYFTADIDRGGNCSLMAPEISTATPGVNMWLDYSKADLWAVGSIIYELFSEKNPFYGGPTGQQMLDSRTYMEDELPALPDTVPEVVRLLARKCLSRDPIKRLSPVDAANIMQIFLWFPNWLTIKPTILQMKESMLIQTADVILRSRSKKEKNSENKLKCTFLQRMNINDLLKIFV